MASIQRTTNKRKRTVDRPYGESLTTTDVLLRLTEKDWNKNNSKSMCQPTVSVITVPKYYIAAYKLQS